MNLQLQFYLSQMQVQQIYGILIFLYPKGMENKKKYIYLIYRNAEFNFIQKKENAKSVKRSCHRYNKTKMHAKTLSTRCHHINFFPSSQSYYSSTLKYAIEGDMRSRTTSSCRYILFSLKHLLNFWPSQINKYVCVQTQLM